MKILVFLLIFNWFLMDFYCLFWLFRVLGFGGTLAPSIGGQGPTLGIAFRAKNPRKMVLVHPSREIVLKFGSNMGQKSILNHIFDPFRALGSVRNGFVFKFPRKWWYREVEGSFLSPFHGHFRFSWVRTISLPGCTTTTTTITTTTPQ